MISNDTLACMLFISYLLSSVQFSPEAKERMCASDTVFNGCNCSAMFLPVNLYTSSFSVSLFVVLTTNFFLWMFYISALVGLFGITLWAAVFRLYKFEPDIALVHKVTAWLFSGMSTTEAFLCTLSYTDIGIGTSTVLFITLFALGQAYRKLTNRNA